jgi:predicted ArsR family transcriptional regulator
MQIYICIIGIIYGMKPTTRFRILEYIRKHQTASVRELSVLMRVSGANIRHHLSLLVSNDLIEAIGMRKEGRGRPQKVYGLSRRVLGDGLDILSDNLLEIWEETIPEEKMEEALTSLANRLGRKVEPNKLEIKRVIATVEVLNELRYQARWEASAAGARIILGHCPYAAIISKHPELCRMDGLILETRIAAFFEQEAKLHLNDKGLPFCAFQMRKGR